VAACTDEPNTPISYDYRVTDFGRDASNRAPISSNISSEKNSSCMLSLLQFSLV
jgi:hypothetical protein